MQLGKFVFAAFVLLLFFALPLQAENATVTPTPTPLPSGPDLVIANISLSNPNPFVGQTFLVTVVTRNDGNAWASNSKTRYRTVWGYNDYAISGLNPGQTSVNASNFTCTYSGTFYFNATADVFNNVSETNESNNFRQVSVYCAPQPQSLPDLTVPAVWISPNNPKVGDTVTYYVTTRNGGIGSSGVSITQMYDSLGHTTNFGVPALASGQNNTNSSSFLCNQTGTVYVNGRADAYYWVNESNESNNLAPQASVYCAPNDLQPDLTVSAIVFSPTNPRVGDTVTVYTTTRNLGTSTAGNSQTALTHNNGMSVFNIPALPANTAVTNTSNYTCNVSGTFVFTGSADAWGAVNESNETNNYKQALLTCAKRTSGGSPVMAAWAKLPVQQAQTGTGYVVANGAASASLLSDYGVAFGVLLTALVVGAYFYRTRK